MAWKIVIGDKSMLVDDLTEKDFVDVCAAHPSVNWLTLYYAPASHPAAFYDLLNVVAKKLEMPTPARPQTIKDSVELLAHLVKVEDDLPTTFEESGLPLVEDDQEMSTSPTSGSQKDGTPNEPDPQPSEIESS